jgi:hypothetical protein
MTGGIHLEHPQFSRLSGQKTFYREFSWKSVAKSRQPPLLSFYPENSPIQKNSQPRQSE